MNRRDLIIGLGGAIALQSGLSACASRAPTAIGMHPWIGYEPLRLAHGFGWLPPELTLSVGADAIDTLDGLTSGELDGGTLTLDETLRARSRGAPLGVVAVLNISAGADVLLARPPIRELTQLRGLPIGVTASAVGELMLAKMLEVTGLRKEDIQIVPLRMDEQIQAWEQQTVAAVITYEPTASLLQRRGAVRVFDSRDIPNTIFDVLAIRHDRMADRQTTLGALVDAHFQALNHIRLNLEDAVYRIAAIQNIDAGEVRAALSGITLPDLAANRKLLHAPSSLSRAAEALNPLMVENGMLPGADPLDDLLVPDLLAALTRERS
ncbi:MAG: ABC transporter substrate-binding protein [Gammaproteobacteria bacterium]